MKCITNTCVPNNQKYDYDVLKCTMSITNCSEENEPIEINCNVEYVPKSYKYQFDVDTIQILNLGPKAAMKTSRAILSQNLMIKL